MMPTVQTLQAELTLANAALAEKERQIRALVEERDALEKQLTTARSDLATAKESGTNWYQSWLGANAAAQTAIADLARKEAELAKITEERNRYYGTLAGALFAGYFDKVTCKELRDPGERMAADMATAVRERDEWKEQAKQGQRTIADLLRERDEAREVFDQSEGDRNKTIKALESARQSALDSKAAAAKWRGLADRLAESLQEISELHANRPKWGSQDLFEEAEEIAGKAIAAYTAATVDGAQPPKL